MAQDEVIAKRYARALAEEARDAGNVDGVGADLKLVAGIVDERGGGGVEEFRDFIASPAVPAKEKVAAVRKMLEQAGVGKATVDFMSILVERDRVDLLPRISRAFAEMSGDMTGVLTADVHTARPLSDDQAARLTRALFAAFGREVRIHQTVEPGLLAGAKVTVGGRTFDGSVLGRLDRMRHHLTAVGGDVQDLQSTAKGIDNA